jgi:hypothetical protein
MECLIVGVGEIYLCHEQSTYAICCHVEGRGHMIWIVDTGTEYVVRYTRI